MMEIDGIAPRPQGDNVDIEGKHDRMTWKKTWKIWSVLKKEH